MQNGPGENAKPFSSSLGAATENGANSLQKRNTYQKASISQPDAVQLSLDAVKRASEKGARRMSRLEGILPALGENPERLEASASLANLRTQLQKLQRSEAELRTQVNLLPPRFLENTRCISHVG